MSGSPAVTHGSGHRHVRLLDRTTGESGHDPCVRDEPAFSEMFLAYMLSRNYTD